MQVERVLTLGKEFRWMEEVTPKGQHAADAVRPT